MYYRIAWLTLCRWQFPFFQSMNAIWHQHGIIRSGGAHSMQTPTCECAPLVVSAGRIESVTNADDDVVVDFQQLVLPLPHAS
jgi:hypothetical protein